MIGSNGDAILPLTPEALEAFRSRHVKGDNRNRYCRVCTSRVWPCPLVRAIAERDRLTVSLDMLMTALDRISTIAEGTPTQPFRTIHEIAGDAMRVGNAAQPATSEERAPSEGGEGKEGR